MKSLNSIKDQKRGLTKGGRGNNSFLLKVTIAILVGVGLVSACLNNKIYPQTQVPGDITMNPKFVFA